MPRRLAHQRDQAVSPLEPTTAMTALAEFREDRRIIGGFNNHERRRGLDIESPTVSSTL